MLLIEKTTRAHYTVLKLFQNEKFILKKKWSKKMPLLLDYKNTKSHSKPLHRHKYYFFTIGITIIFHFWNIFSAKQQAEF